MRPAYVDSSCLVAIALDEPGARELAVRLKDTKRLLTSNLLEAELRSTLTREGVENDCAALLSWLTWIFPDRPLSHELEEVLAAGYLRGADLWHLACALFISPRPHELSFLTLDIKQGEVAAALGFPGLEDG